jgi:hypothetical protein
MENGLKDFVEKILELSKDRLIEVEGRHYSWGDISPIHDPSPDPIYVSTLESLIDYLKSNPDNKEMESLIAHVRSPREVALLSCLYGEYDQRDTLIVSKFEYKPFAYGNYFPLEEFIVAAQVGFVQDDNLETLVRLVGNVTDESSVKYSDDGISQEVQARTGVARVGTVVAPKNFVLRPHRTFPSVEQPASPFLFRMRKREDESPRCALFEMDGGKWSRDAINNVGLWIRERSPEGVTVLS